MELTRSRSSAHRRKKVQSRMTSPMESPSSSSFHRGMAQHGSVPSFRRSMEQHGSVPSSHRSMGSPISSSSHRSMEQHGSVLSSRRSMGSPISSSSRRSMDQHGSVPSSHRGMEPLSSSSQMEQHGSVPSRSVGQRPHRGTVVSNRTVSLSRSLAQKTPQRLRTSHSSFPRMDTSDNTNKYGGSTNREKNSKLESHNLHGTEPSKIKALGDTIALFWKTIAYFLFQLLVLNTMSAVTNRWDSVRPNTMQACRPSATKQSCLESEVSPSTVRDSGEQPNRPSACEPERPTSSVWEGVVKELGLQKYFPSKLKLQDVRSLRAAAEDTPLQKKSIPWRVLDQIMLMNPLCREYDINKFARSTQQQPGKRRTKVAEGKRRQFNQQKKDKDNAPPHPMDLMVLLFECGDFMVRQVLARKLFMCRLAIPFLVPIAEDTVEMLLWPLRSIVMEWRDGGEAREEALVSSQVNRIAFIRYGKIKFSKSKLMNDVLSPSGHSVFFHQGAPCGNEKRIISNGTVEMTHFLPGENKQDQFTQPALFFNLRGDACDYPVQRGVLMDLATVLVIMLDVSQLSDTSVQDMFGDTRQHAGASVVVILTDNQGHDERDPEQDLRLLYDIIGDDIDNVQIITTFDLEGNQKNISSLNEEVREAISVQMTGNPETSLQQFALNQTHCLIDECANDDCSRGKHIANDLIALMAEHDVLRRKQTLLPQQGDCLHDMARLMRLLHRSPSKDAPCMDKEDIKAKIKEVRRRQSNESNQNHFIHEVISLLDYETEIREFAVRWTQLELDSMSRSVLPQLLKEKNAIWNEVEQARNERNEPLVAELEDKAQRADEDIIAATCGWEHLMREVGQLYEVSLELRKQEREVAALPRLVGRQLLEGQPVELLDGDHGIMPITWIKEVFHALAQMAGQDKKIFVLSVLGIQSSGKSTLLNTMFGLEFAVSAGRCTRGIYAQLLPVADRKHLPFDYMLVLDSEGLRTHEQEEKNYEHDNELATLIIGLSDLALINMKGENVTEMTDVLQIVVYAFLRMKLADSPHKRQVMFVHQNVAAVNAQDKLAVDRQKLQGQLNNMAKQASEAQGLAETITSFNRLINFDGQRDVVYFSDLWHGDPPMATVNQGYSMRAVETKQRLLQDISQNRSGFITISDFILRVGDMWKGVLADDFVFSFRNSLAAKSYIQIEREYGRLTLDFEQETLDWVTGHANIQTEKCKTEDELEQCHGRLTDSLTTEINKRMVEKIEQLEKLFDNHPAREIVIQWRSEKLSSFEVFCQALKNRTQGELGDARVRKLYDLRQTKLSSRQEQEIIRRAMEIAKQLRGNSSDEELEQQFDIEWKKWADDIVSSSPEKPQNALADLSGALHEMMRLEGNIKYLKGLNDAFVADESLEGISPGDINVEDHLILKDVPIWKKFVHLFKPIDHLETATKKANDMMQVVLEKIETICSADSMFNSVHAREVMRLLFEEVAKHNDGKKSPFSFTPQFKAMLGIRTACCAAPKFDRMMKRFEDKHGVPAKMKAYRGRVFLLFKNTVKQTAGEVAASEYLCEGLKAKVKELVRRDLEKCVLQDIYQAVGNTKYDLIIKMLDEIARNEDFGALCNYVTKPFRYASEWLDKFGHEHLFTPNNDATKYSEYANRCADTVFAQIVASASHATEAVEHVQTGDQYATWIKEFCLQLADTLPLDPEELMMPVAHDDIMNYNNYQRLLGTNLEQLETEITSSFCHVTPETVTWLTESPFRRVCYRLWGCREHCPFCAEPCQDSNPDHQTSHRCVQHRPPGIRGIVLLRTRVLDLYTCAMSVASSGQFRCVVIGYLCRNTEHCNATGSDIVYHNDRDYKKYLPDWDIAPDPAGEASKYWQWVVCTFENQLLERYTGCKLDIPHSWRDTTKQEAIDSLRVFY